MFCHDMYKVKSKKRRLVALVCRCVEAMLLTYGSATYAAGTTGKDIAFPKIEYQPARLMVGIMLPASPDTYQQYISLMSNKKQYHEGIFEFTTGDVDGVHIVLSSPPPIGSFSLTAIDTYLMERIFKLSIMIDPGTAGSHLPMLSMGDVVIGARVVNFSNYMTKSDGAIVPGQFSALVSDNEGYKKGNPNPEYIYADPFLVKLAEHAASEAQNTPAKILSAPVGRKPWIITYGTQGSGEAWLRNIQQIRQSTRIFHEADEAGNYPIALVSTLNKVPFVEVHTISDAALNVLTKMNRYFHECSVFAQDRSNKIVFRMIKALASHPVMSIAFTGGFHDPWQPGTFAQAAFAPASVQDWTKKYGINRG